MGNWKWCQCVNRFPPAGSHTIFSVYLWKQYFFACGARADRTNFLLLECWNFTKAIGSDPLWSDTRTIAFQDHLMVNWKFLIVFSCFVTVSSGFQWFWDRLTRWDVPASSGRRGRVRGCPYTTPKHSRPSESHVPALKTAKSKNRKSSPVKNSSTRQSVL